MSMLGVVAMAALIVAVVGMAGVGGDVVWRNNRDAQVRKANVE